MKRAASLSGLALGLAAVVALVLGFAPFAVHAERGGAQAAAASEPVMPDTASFFAGSLSQLDGRRVALADFRGKPMIVNFWARWCAPCRKEIPLLAKVHEQHGEQIEVLGIGIEDDGEKVREFANAYDMHYRLFVARQEGIDLMRDLGNARAMLPYTVLIDRAGKVIWLKLGGIAENELTAQVERLLQTGH